ncbi:MAG: DUF6702 family protein [Pseudomonadota bacterium]
MKKLWLLILALLLAVPALAHQQKAAITTVEHNARTGLLEVIHFVPLHDAEHALRERGNASPDIVGDIQSRRDFALYVASRFEISTEIAPIQLRILGSEIDGGNLVIFSEAYSPGRGTPIAVRSLILTDIWPSQVNRVNIGPSNAPTTLVFRSGDRAKSAILQ